MTGITGSFNGKASYQTTACLNDTPQHELLVGQISGSQNSPDAKWNNSQMTYWGVTDHVAGNGTQRGYFVNRHTDGDTDRGTFEGTIKTNGNEVNLEGKFNFTGGTGKYNGMTGSGTYKGRMTSPTDVQMNWNGSYQLAEARAGAG